MTKNKKYIYSLKACLNKHIASIFLSVHLDHFRYPGDQLLCCEQLKVFSGSLFNLGFLLHYVQVPFTFHLPTSESWKLKWQYGQKHLWTRTGPLNNYFIGSSFCNLHFPWVYYDMEYTVFPQPPWLTPGVASPDPTWMWTGLALHNMNGSYFHCNSRMTEFARWLSPHKGSILNICIYPYICIFINQAAVDAGWSRWLASRDFSSMKKWSDIQSKVNEEK